MTDKQLQNSFLANGSTIEEEVDTATKGPEEEERLKLIKCGDQYQ